MPGRVVVQWDKEDCADMGIVKVDLLGLGMMAVLQDAMTMVNEQDAGSATRRGRRRWRTDPFDPTRPGRTAQRTAGGDYR